MEHQADSMAGRTGSHVSCYMLRAGKGGLADWTFVVSAHCKMGKSNRSVKEKWNHPYTKRRHSSRSLDNMLLRRRINHDVTCHTFSARLQIHCIQIQFISKHTSIAKKHYRRPLLLLLIQLAIARSSTDCALANPSCISNP